MSNFAGFVRELGRVGADRDQVQREVADHLRRRRHLDDVAEDVVGRGVHVLDLLELLAEPERDRLLAQVGELAAGDLVACRPGRSARAARTRTARRPGARPPSTAPGRTTAVERQPGLARRSGRSRRPAPTAAAARWCRPSRRVAASTASTPASIAASRVAELAARGVVGVQVHRQVEPLAQRGDQRPRGRRAEQPGHVLDRQHVRAGVDDLLGQPQVVVERVELLAGVGEVAGVAERDLGDRRAGLAHRVDRRPHLLDVVERVEDPEDVDAGGRGLLDEGVGDLGRVRRVADGVAAAQQHLQADVRHRLAQRGEPLPRVLGEEAQRDVVRRAAPGLERPAAAGVIRATWPATASRSRVRTRVASSDWWASRNVVSVTATSCCSRSRRANASGPSSSSRWRVPSGAGTSRSTSGSLLTGSRLTGAGPCGWLTVTSAR